MDARERLAIFRGDPTRRARRPNVRSLAKYAANAACNLASLGFAAGIDLDRALQGTRFGAPFGQSVFAFRRGNRFEERLRDNGHLALLEQVKAVLGYDVSSARVANVRDAGAYGKDVSGRAAATERLVRGIVRGDGSAPNLLDGAVLSRTVAGVPSFFEADAVAARFESPLHVGEIKSFPTVDGQADPDKVGAAVAQVAIYIVLLRDLVVRVGGKPELVSDSALLITPRNTGLQPTIAIKAVGREVDRAALILDRAPSALEIVDALPANLPSFRLVSDDSAEEEARIDAALEIAETVGTKYAPSCLSSCGMARLCRERAHRCGSPDRLGGQLVRMLPRIDTLDRVVELGQGAPPRPEEAAVASQLVRADRLLARVRRAS